MDRRGVRRTGWSMTTYRQIGAYRVYFGFFISTTPVSSLGFARDRLCPGGELVPPHRWKRPIPASFGWGGDAPNSSIKCSCKAAIALIALILLALASGAAAQEAATPEVRYDSSAVVSRAPGPDALQPYRADADFLYEREPPQTFSLWDRINQWLDEHIFGPLGDVTPDWVGEWFFYLLAAAGIAFAIVRLLRMDLGGVFYGKREQARLAFETVAEDLHETDFDQLIDEAVAARHYRRAVRLLYLKTLKALVARHLIDWQRDKTNQEYVDELRAPALRRPFAALTTLFEYVWYGDFPVDETVFGRVRGSFTRFDEQMQEG